MTFDAGPTAFLVSAQGRTGDDGEDGDGNTIENSSFRDYGVAARASRIGSFGVVLGGIAIDRGRDLERPAAPGDPSRTNYPVEDSDRLTLSLDKPGAGGWSSFRLSGFAGRYRQALDRSTPTATGGETTSSSDTESWDAAFRATGTARSASRGSRPASTSAQARPRVSARRRVVDADGTSSRRPPPSRSRAPTGSTAEASRSRRQPPVRLTIVALRWTARRHDLCEERGRLVR